MSHFVKDPGYSQDRPTTLKDYVCKLIAIAKGKGCSQEIFLNSEPIRRLASGCRIEKIRAIVDEHWDKTEGTL